VLIAEPIDWAATNGRAVFPNVEFAPGTRAICRRFLHVPRDAHWAEVTLRGTKALGMPDDGVNHCIEGSEAFIGGSCIGQGKIFLLLPPPPLPRNL
jgi:hypothetical protein